MSKIRVLVVDDAVVIRRLISSCLASDPEMEVIGNAANGQIALLKILQTNPDIVTLDVEMPVMDGIETLKAIRKKHPRLPVVMFSTLTERGACATLDALTHGASDYVTKPANVGSVGEGLQRVRDQLIPKIKALARRGDPIRSAPPLRPQTIFSPVEAIGIGVSTGGPNALSTLLPSISKSLPVPILIVQHMPPLFTRLLSERLQMVSGLPVREGFSGAVLTPGTVWIAPGGFHMEVDRVAGQPLLRLHDRAPENSCRPAVDVLFRSLARVYGAGTLGVVLTGMGSDGLRGCEAIYEAGGRVLVQDAESSVVWGMPGAVAQAGLADKILPLPQLAVAINERLGKISKPSILNTR